MVRIALVAGEASGDQLGAGLICRLRQDHPQAEFYGIGGPLMRQAGFNSLYDMEEISMIGLESVFTKLPGIIGIRRKLAQNLIGEEPDLFVGIDVPDFNLGLESKLASHSITCIHYVSPTIWAWRGFRIKTIKQAVAHMLVLFPFELDIYKSEGVPVTFVGHPVADEVDDVPDQLTCREGLGLKAHNSIIALLPGSRSSEISRHAGLFLETARQLQQQQPQINFVLSAVNQSAFDYLSSLVNNEFQDLNVKIILGQSRKMISASDLVLAASGTITLETALLEKPMVMAYKVSKLSEWMIKAFASVDHYAMPNFLLDTPLIPEFVQDQATATNLSRALLDYYTNPEKCRDLINKFKEVKDELKVNSNDRSAAVVNRFLEQAKS